MSDKDIIEIYTNKVIHSWNDIPNDHKEYLLNRFSDSESIKESCWRILYNIEKRPVCKICGKRVEFVGRKHNIFAKTCSAECTSKLKHINQYGVKLSDEQIKNRKIKIKQTLLERYGDEHYNNRNKAKLTCLEKYGETSYNKTNEGKEKIKKSMQEKYGVDYAAYLDTNIFKTNNPQRNKEIKERTRQTNIKKYGGPSPTSSKEIYLKQRKSFKEKNKNFKSSKFEEYVYVKLQSKFNNIIRNYNTLLEEQSNRYPYNCDFYIKDFDLFIEIQGSQFHHFHPFDSNNSDDINELKRLKQLSKNHEQYGAMINIWTIHDVEKRNIAEKNNLNFKEFYTQEEFDNWFNKIGDDPISNIN